MQNSTDLILLFLEDSKMKKIFLSLILVFIFCSSVFGASSDDIYLRRDVFEAKMDVLIQKIDSNFAILSARIDSLEKRIDGVDKRIDGVDKRIDGLEASLNKRIDGIDKKTDAILNIIYLILVMLGTILIAPFVQKWLEFRSEKPEPAFTLEDVKKLIDERFAVHNVSLAGK